MSIEARRVIVAAVEAAIDEAQGSQTNKRRLPAGRAFLLGAGLMTVGRLAAGSRGRQMVGALQDRWSELEEELLQADEEEPEPEADGRERVADAR